jgi:glycosyltransferase involved in cell wall biosynthesis
MTSARQLGQTTVSMLQGPAGRQAKELQRLLGWLRTVQKGFDLVCLSNALLVGLAEPIRRLGLPVVCLLQDEDGFLDALPRPYSDKAWELIRSAAGYVRCFVAVSHYYAGLMRGDLAIYSSKVCVIPIGVNHKDYVPAQGPSDTPVIGYLSRLSWFGGLDLLVETFLCLRRVPGLGLLQLRLCGGQERGDKAFVRRMIRRCRAAGLGDAVSFWPWQELRQRQAFFDGLTVLAVPETRPVAAARYALEALACGVPVVGPDHGVLPELQSHTGGLVLYKDHTVQSLGAALEYVLRDRQGAFELGKSGREGLLRHYTMDLTVSRFVDLCMEVVRS